MTDSIEARVARGAALLDEKRPGWVEHIDLDTLDLKSSCDCILGQEFIDHPDVDLDGWGTDASPYDIGQEVVFDPEDDVFQQTIDHGFNANGNLAEYDDLTAEWQRIILARRGGAS